MKIKKGGMDFIQVSIGSKKSRERENGFSIRHDYSGNYFLDQRLNIQKKMLKYIKVKYLSFYFNEIYLGIKIILLNSIFL